MNFFKQNERLLKHNLKNKRSITLGLIVAFLITGEIGGFFETEIFARDLRPRQKQNNDIRPDSGGPNMDVSANGTDVVNIVDPNKGGISHNKFIDFSVGNGNGVIFNNNSTKGPSISKIGGIVSHNPNLQNSASAILSEVTGNKVSAINGIVEVAGQRADFILANENGISVNGGGFVNTSGVTLTTGRPIVNGSNVDLDVKKGEIIIESGGVGTAGDYFNIVSKTIELRGQIAPLIKGKNADITLLAGQNKVTLKTGSVKGLSKDDIQETGHEKDTDKKYGIYADKLGAMYGKNIRLISTTEGLGVRHEGVINGENNIEILSNGDIELGGVNTEKKSVIKGKNLKTIYGEYTDKANNIDKNYSIYSKEGLEISVEGNIEVESLINSDDLKITGKNLILKAGKSANITSDNYLVMKISGETVIEKLLIPIKKGTGSKKALVILKDSDGNVIVKDPTTGNILSPNEIEWVSSGILGKNIDLDLGSLINDGAIDGVASSKIKATNIKNNKLISSTEGELSIDSKKIVNSENAVIRGTGVKIKALNIENAGELRQNTGTKDEIIDRANKVQIDIQNGSLINKGIIAGYNVDIKGSGFILNESNGKIEITTEEYPRGTGKLLITVETLENKGAIQAHGKGRTNDIVINTKTLINYFGAKIIAQKGELSITTTVGDILNSGELFADKDIKIISAKDVKNSGKIGGANIGITTTSGELENYGKIAAVQKLIVHVNNLINAGTSKETSKYLTAFNSYVQESYDSVVKSINELEKKIKVATSSNEVEGLQSALEYYQNLERELNLLKYELERVGALGILSGNEVNLKTNTNIENNGIVKAVTSINLDAKNNIDNTGVVEGENTTLKAGGDIINTQRLYADKSLNIEGKSFTSLGSEKSVKRYVDLMLKYDPLKLEKAETKIKELEAQLIKSTNKIDIEKLKAELKRYRVIKKEQASYKAEIITIKGLGTVEGENITVKVIEKIENNGIVTAKKDLALNSTNGDIINNLNISVGKNATIKGNNFINKMLTVGEEFIGKVARTFDSESLTVVGNAKIDANSVIIKKKISVGENTTVNLSENNAEINFETGSKGDLNKNLTVNGGAFINKGEVIIGGQGNIDTTLNTSNLGNKGFKNEGNFEVVETLNINSEGFNNTGSINIGKNIDIDAGAGKIENINKIQVKEDGNFVSQGFNNQGNIILEGKADINAGTGYVENKSFEAMRDITITTMGDIKNTEKLNTSSKLKVIGKSFENITGAEVVNTGTEIEVSEDIKNAGNIEITGDITLKGTGDNSALTNGGNIKATNKGKVDVKRDLDNNGILATGENLEIKTGSLTNKGIVQSGKNLKIELTKNLTNENLGKIFGKNIEVDGKNAINGSKFINKGNIISNTRLTVEYGSKDVDVELKSDSKISSKELMTIKTGGAITNESRLQNMGSLDFSAGKNLTNKKMIVSTGDIKFQGKNIINEKGTSVWTAKTLVLNAINMIWNKLQATIESKGDMTLTAAHLVNDAGNIKAGGDLTINADKVENKSVVKGSGYKEVEKEETVSAKIQYQWIGVARHAYVEVIFPRFESNLIVTDSAGIQSNGNLVINGKNGNSSKSNIINTSGLISSGKNMRIYGDLKNETPSTTMSVDEYMSKIKVIMQMQVKDAVTGGDLVGWQTWNYGNLKDALSAIKSKKKDDPYFKALVQSANSEKGGPLKALISAALGPDWVEKGIDMSKYKGSAKYNFYATNGNAKLIAGGTFSHLGGKFENIGGEKVENKKIDVSVGQNKIEGVEADLGISVKDPNSITEVDGVKQIHPVEIQIGTVTINGVIIASGSGGGVSSIAVAGTINPVVFIDIPIGSNGIFRPALPKPNGTVPYLFETNIDFIDISKYYGSDYFFKQIGYNPNKTPTTIGDAYYEQQLINNTIKEGLGYSGGVSTEQIKIMLDNAISVKDKLGLETGKPLIPDQINSLEEDIIWYVEMEVQGQIVLVPQVYFGKETRLKMAKANKGVGVGSSVQAGGNIIIDATDVVNSNGNISSGGNMIIASENNIVNSSASGIGGGINASGHVALDAEKNIEMIGGSVSGNAVVVDAGGDVNIESTLTYDENGNQTIGELAGINAESGIVINAGNDVSIKGGSLKVNGKEVPQEEAEKSQDAEVSNGNAIEEDMKDEKKPEVVKDVNYYKELFTKEDVRDIIGGPIGSINIDAGNDVNIGDLNVVSSSSSYQEEEGITKLTKKLESKSVGSNVNAETIDINAKNDVTIKGSQVVATEKTSIKAGKKVDIIDGQDYYHETTTSQISGAINGLLTTGSETSETTAILSKGSVVGGFGGLTIESKGNTTIKGSKLIGGTDGIGIESGGKVEILDGQNTLRTSSDSSTYNGLGYTKSSENTSLTKSKGSELNSDGVISILSKDGIKSVGTKFVAVEGMNIISDGDIKFEAGKNTYNSKKSSISLGVTNAGASGGAGGSSASAGWNQLDGSSTGIINGDPVQVGKDSQNKKNSKGGKNYMDSLADASVQIGVSVNNSNEKSITWTEGDIQTGGQLNIISGGTADIGGTDIEAKKLKIRGKNIATTKYKDVIEKESSGVDIGVVVRNSTTSSIADVTNKAMQIADSVKDGTVNEGLTSAQVAGSATNLVFGDLAANTTSSMVTFGWDSNNSKKTKENITNLKVEELDFEATDGNIDLIGVQGNAKNIKLLAKKGKLNVRDAKETVTEHKKGFNISLGNTASTGVGLIDGGNAQLGYAGNISYNQSDINNELTHKSSLVAENKLIIETEKEANVIGSIVKGKDVDLKLGGGLNVVTQTNKIDESRIEFWAGGDASAGVATNTLLTGDFGVSVGGGKIYKKGDEVATQAGIIAENKLTTQIDGDVNLVGGVLGSETGNGNVNIGGNINSIDIHTNLNAGGAIVGLSGGTKGGGIQGEVGDIVNKEQTAKGGISLNNINVDGNIITNGNLGSKTDINVDINNSLTTDRDEYKQGGTFSGTGSKIPTKKSSSGGSKTANKEKIDTSTQSAGNVKPEIGNTLTESPKISSDGKHQKDSETGEGVPTKKLSTEDEGLVPNKKLWEDFDDDLYKLSKDFDGYAEKFDGVIMGPNKKPVVAVYDYRNDEMNPLVGNIGNNDKTISYVITNPKLVPHNIKPTATPKLVEVTWEEYEELRRRPLHSWGQPRRDTEGNYLFKE